MWKMNPPKNTQLVCVSNFPVVTYSGMLPGVISGQYPKSAMEIDLIRLAQSAGARVIVDEVTGLDHEKRQLLFRDRPPLAFDIMSIGIGSRPTFAGIEVPPEAPLLAVKPMQTFLARLGQRLEQLRGKNDLKIAVVGGGIGSIEIAFCLHERFHGRPKYAAEALSTDFKPEISIVTRGSQLGSGLLDSTSRKTRLEFANRNVKVFTDSEVVAVDANGLQLKNNNRIDADMIIWATGAVAGPLLGKLGLETDERGFLLTRDTLEVTRLPGVFAVGDTGTIIGSKISKAGVFAVRQGPVLHKNILRKINGSDNLLSYHPQTDFLKLINLGNDKAIAEYKGRSFLSGWSWKLKDRIDVKFMRKYQDYAPMKMTSDVSEDAEQEMRCLGCGGKIGGEILGQVLSELQIENHPDVKIGLNNPDDAAVVATANNEVTVTTDFFAAPFDDPYLVGRIAVLNSASDCFVMGAQPNAALAIVQIPTGHPRAQTQVMREVMTGSVEELNRMGAAIVGGHSIEGPRMMIGYTILGKQIIDPTTKGQLKPGDQLILTKPLGTGVLLAGWMQCKMPAACFQPLIDAMLKSNQIALELVDKFPISSMTDVTGFGFAGHLIEMMRASQISAEIKQSEIPVLPGSRELLAAGIESTLAPDNRTLLEKVRLQGSLTDPKSMGTLVDPQTGGGLLFGIAPEHSAEVVQFLQDAGFAETAIIGSCTEQSDSQVLTIE